MRLDLCWLGNSMKTKHFYKNCRRARKSSELEQNELRYRLSASIIYIWAALRITIFSFPKFDNIRLFISSINVRVTLVSYVYVYTPLHVPMMERHHSFFSQDWRCIQISCDNCIAVRKLKNQTQYKSENTGNTEKRGRAGWRS